MSKVWIVVPCGAAKVDHAAPARDLYTGSAFRHALRAAEGEAEATARDCGVEAEVLILSALHGLVRLDQVLDPYNVKMGDADSITVDALAAQVPQVGMQWRDEVYAMLPKAYYSRLAQAAMQAEDIAVQDVYEAAPGIGYQRGVASCLMRHH
jgi:hypothetical protein